MMTSSHARSMAGGSICSTWSPGGTGIARPDRTTTRRLVAAAHVDVDAADVVGVQVVERRARPAHGDADLRRDRASSSTRFGVVRRRERDHVEQERPLRLLRAVHERVEDEREAERQELQVRGSRSRCARTRVASEVHRLVLPSVRGEFRSARRAWGSRWAWPGPSGGRRPATAFEARLERQRLAAGRRASTREPVPVAPLGGAATSVGARSAEGP